MKAIGVYEFGGPEVLQVVDLPEPQAGPGEVRIRVYAAAVSPTDVMLRTGGHAVRMPDRRPPFVPGMDAAGVIDQLGPGCGDRLHVGQRVIAMVLFVGEHGGAYAEQIVVPAASVVPAPANADFPEASTLLMNAMTARLALDTLALPADATVAVTGAAGAVGGYAVELAKADGLRVVADAAARDVELVRGFGADHVVERGPNVAARMREVVPDGVAGLVDASHQQAEVLGAIADGGTLIELRGWAGPAERGIRVLPVMVPDRITDTEALAMLSRQAENGVLTLRVAEVLPADEAAKAHRMLEAGGLRGRVVLDFS
ncbi:NADP-dependent oxidoreductase [Mycolicibacterium goodii]|uniref:NADP-dependent oxidoreductase n=1 Tax=Mycolicibacterium goodii TaxID=134601 RepID=A0ABS6HI53_MYCGD|nr:NADP-dependent oxidoreductase [Mycolicibacterium goodii]OKH69988.1 alcohol dehydrogenase [Mycobacterium sp. SWH-M5]MBU8811115.1 NADP-dependent oxidoreductase [Mycolicibacterium goodii]MBU8815058.1 NADP-dependent oxidoreductase [Mycolicibacterium goodii]MBU8821590.1 NADP-dependent oxidoreductase [Mycolicibacterium goodii]MBU8836085.1 NADP-dependent oxidoreductase [Mycolicibacterium goodii]